MKKLVHAGWNGREVSGVMVSAKVKGKVYKTVARLSWFRQVQRRDAEFQTAGQEAWRLVDVEDIKVTGVREEDAEDRVIWRPLFCCGDP